MTDLVAVTLQGLSRIRRWATKASLDDEVALGLVVPDRRPARRAEPQAAPDRAPDPPELDRPNAAE